jgi:hypothetical protein
MFGPEVKVGLRAELAPYFALHIKYLHGECALVIGFALKE